MKIFDFETIQSGLNSKQVLEALKAGFIAHSRGKVRSLISHFPVDNGSLHIKGAMLEGDPYFFIKLATGFSGNWKQGLPTGDGCILGFSSVTGALELILFDKGYLTDHRTALAARICVEQFSPPQIESIGILGTGVQARLCAEYQAEITQCRNLKIWGRNQTRLDSFKIEMERKGFQVDFVDQPNALLDLCDVVFTTTASREPLLTKESSARTQLIIAIGADEPGKQELSAGLVASATHWVADDKRQSVEIGEFQHAFQMKLTQLKAIQELGDLLSEKRKLHHQNGLVICDLSGLPIQDIQISKVFLGSALK